MSNTEIKLTATTLRALAVGIDRLNDGDDSDRQAADEAAAALARAGYVVSGGAAYTAAGATSGYTAAGYTYQCFDGSWSGGAREGDTLYHDEGCTIPLRTL